MTLPIPAPARRLGLADLKACLALSADRGWPSEEHKWTLLLDAAEGYGIDDPDGGLAGSVVLARYGTELASARMMLVASRYGRQGLGRQLMAHISLTGPVMRPSGDHDQVFCPLTVALG